MRPLQLLCLITVASIHSFAQENIKETYLAVRMVELYDKTNQVRYFSLAPDLYNNYAANIYELVPHKEEPYKNNTGICFYFQKTDSTRFLFNYFRSQTEALQFLADANWRLLSVTTEINSGYQTTSSYARREDHVYTTITSRPVFYFKKNLP